MNVYNKPYFNHDSTLETPSGSPTHSAMPLSSEIAGENVPRTPRQVRFNPEVVIYGIFQDRIVEKRIEEEKGASSYLVRSGFCQNDPLLRSLTSRPSDTYKSEFSRLQKRALMAAKRKASREKIILARRQMNSLNQATETFTRQEILELLKSATRLKAAKAATLTTRAILKRFREFAAKKSKFPSSEPGMRVCTRDRGRHFTVIYENIPKAVLDDYEMNQDLDCLCYRGKMDDLIPLLKTMGKDKMVILSSDRLVEDLGGYIGVKLSDDDQLEAYHWHFGGTGEVVVTQLFIQPHRKQVYLFLQAFLDELKVSIADANTFSRQ